MYLDTHNVQVICPLIKPTSNTSVEDKYLIFSQVYVSFKESIKNRLFIILSDLNK